MRRDGYVCHLYAGPDQGFAMMRAWKQAGGEEKELLEIDLSVARSATCCWTLAHTLDWSGRCGRASSWLWLEDQTAGPGVLCATSLWNGNKPHVLCADGNDEEFGVKDATPEEEKKVKEDDVLMWRVVFLAMLDHYLKEVRGSEEKMGVWIGAACFPTILHA